MMQLLTHVTCYYFRPSQYLLMRATAYKGVSFCGFRLWTFYLSVYFLENVFLTNVIKYTMINRIDMS